MAITMSKLMDNFMATIPESVRRRLNLVAGDLIEFDVVGDVAILRKANSDDLVFDQGLEGLLSEWATDVDEEAYRSL
ncbi:MAG TPA: AbrB/MazE/SpoVT family DNA-binding domain-containing protein [Gammaproteobacteria bacterium]|nr:AbrB/MazE/SpoVT family DNA-binding domain-containing protein [Gammaproteobacteria bacterium]